MIVKDFKYVIKRIIIGVGIALVLMLIKGNLLMQVHAQEVNAVPNDILIATGQGVSTYSPSTNTWNGQTVYALPSNMSYDWGSGVSLYFRYPQNSGATYCDFASNKATLSGRLYNASTSSIGTPLVQFEDTTAGGYTRCSSQTTSNYVDFICNNINSSHGFNIQIGNAPNGRWGIVRQLNFECIQSGADITANINANNNQNTQNIINNQNNNTQNIINNNNENTDKTIKSQYVCKDYKSSTSSQLKNSYLNSNGSVVDSSNRGVSRYIGISSSSKIVVSTITNDSYLHLCFYNSSKDMLSCMNESSLSRNQVLTIPTDASYVRFSFGNSSSPTFNVCTNGNQALSDTLTDDNVDQANADFEQWFQQTHIDTHGLSSIITAPLRLIQGMLGTTCVPLTFPLPFVNQNVVLPCMTPIYTEYFGNWFTLYRFITDGVIAYWVAVNVFRKMQDFLDPTDDKVEVFDL